MLTTAAAIDRAFDRIPVVWAFLPAATVGFWTPWLKQLSGIAGDFGPILAAALALAKIWAIVSDNGRPKPVEKIEALASLADAASKGPKSAGLIGALLLFFGSLFRRDTMATAKAQTVTIPAGSLAPVKVTAKPAAKGSKLAPKIGPAQADPDGGETVAAPINIDARGEPRHLAIARALIGVRETPGPGNNPEVVSMFRAVGFSQPDATPWCAVFVGACLVRAGLPYLKSMTARSYLDYGSAVDVPRIGDIVVTRRAGSEWQGHVFFYLGRDSAGRILGLGGNQSDGVNVKSFDPRLVLPGGFRRPPSPPTPLTSRTMAGGALGLLAGGVSLAALIAPETAASILAMGGEIEKLSAVDPRALWLSVGVSILGHIAAIYARQTDFADKGR